MKLSVVLNVLVLACLICLGIYVFRTEKKVAFINNGDVFNAFLMTKEIDKDVKRIEEQKKGILDSIADQLKKAQAGIVKIDENRFDYLKNDFLTKRSQFSEDIARLKQTSMEKVWKQINQYVSDFAKEKNYDIVLGANGQGGLMYAKENIDITKETISYINDKYSGNK
jgi:outer membrane protein